MVQEVVEATCCMVTGFREDLLSHGHTSQKRHVVNISPCMESRLVYVMMPLRLLRAGGEAALLQADYWLGMGLTAFHIDITSVAVPSYSQVSSGAAYFSVEASDAGPAGRLSAQYMYVLVLSSSGPGRDTSSTAQRYGTDW